MGRLANVSGVSKILRNMKKATGNIETKVGKGLKKGGLFLQRESMKVVPVDLNNLRPSARTDNIGGKGFKTDIVVHYGAGADYAVYVHEDLEARHKAGKRAKYLESVARQKQDEIFRIIGKG